MINKVYDKIVNYIKENYKSLIVLLVFILLISIPTGYEIYTPGGLLNMDKRIVIENEYKSEGSINLTFVGVKNGNLPSLLIASILPSWDIVKKNNSKIEQEDYDDVIKRNKIMLKNGVSYSTLFAYKEAGKDVSITKNELTVLHVMKNSDNKLKVGDILLKANGKVLSNYDDFREVIDLSNDSIEIEVKRDNKIINVNAKIYTENKQKIVGVLLTNYLELKTNPPINFKYNESESGSSGGLMNALVIYNKLTKDDITKGKKIAGTGTLEIDGTVGEIDGIKYKLKGANKKKVDIFLVPTKNMKEAVEVKEKYNLNIKLVEAKTFKDVLALLKNI
ncbi:MAG: S16 family serine protease [Bacilli bacterium]